MKVLLLQLDGKMPNLALMRLASHHKERGDEVELRRTPTASSVDRQLWDDYERVYASLIFERTRPVADRLRQVYPEAIIGGTGWDLSTTLEVAGVTTTALDYSIYPSWSQSIGFTQRGCRLKCSFCVVPRKEGDVQEVASINDIWRGSSWPRHLILLDNDFFGQPHWRERIQEIRDGGFRVNFNQGINARMLSEEAAEAIGSVDYRADNMKTRRLYTAWDNRGDEEVLFRGLNRLVKFGVKPDHIMVYMLIGYWPGETEEDWLHRASRLRDFGARPYPMPFLRTRLAVGFQRWIVGAYDKRIPWETWKQAECEPRRLIRTGRVELPLFGEEEP